MEEKSGLKKTITFWPALSMVVGTVIGAGVFFKASAVTQYTGSSSLSMLAWFVGGVVTICAGLTGAELAAAIPQTGGLTTYIEHTYGSFWGFLAGWAQGIIYFPANVAALAIVFGTQTCNLLGLSNGLIVPIAIIAAVSLTFINFAGAKAAGYVQTIATVVKLIPLALIVVFGFFHQGGGDFSLFPVVAGPHHNFWTALGNATFATMFAYDGWIHVGNIAGEMKNPKRDLPLAISMGIVTIMAVYLLVNAVFLYILPINHIAGNLNAASDVAGLLFGGIGGKLVTIGILISVYGGLNGYTTTGMRIPMKMGQEHKLPWGDKFSELTKNTAVPWFSGIIQLIIACLMMLSGQFDSITNMLVFVIWIFYVMAFIAVFVLRKREPDLERPYKVPLYPIIPIIAIIGGIFILVVTLFTQWLTSAIGIVLTLIGICFYYPLNKKYHFSEK
ncbi:amino acid permease [Lentilactobacillus senioris]|uniref:APC family permease n=1 Tax=Lentilactobacillus senioris TaxID=931534 RepID=UPI00227FA97A|nr:amino acid permease [Lentilactobacillus senioris]MCY9806271.1 amino acid permease [Lentilactobacillus senioris]